jgi:hypothetical protein
MPVSSSGPWRSSSPRSRRRCASAVSRRSASWPRAAWWTRAGRRSSTATRRTPGATSTSTCGTPGARRDTVASRRSGSTRSRSATLGRSSRYNTLRFRDAEVGPKPKASVAFSSSGTRSPRAGVKEEDTLARALGRLLDASAPGRFEVRNAGRRGSTSRSSPRRSRRRSYDPDLVVYALTLNDAVQPPPFGRGGSSSTTGSSTAPALPDARSPRRRPCARGPRLLSDRRRLRRGGARRHGGTSTWSDAANREGWVRTQEHVREMDRRLQAARRPAAGRAVASLRVPRGATLRDRARRSGDSASPRASHTTSSGRPSAGAGLPISGCTRRPPPEQARSHRLAAESLLPAVLQLAGI